jgi:hypothetical protein
MKLISPQPNTWYRIWLDLKAEWENRGKVGLPPPTAFVLSSWTLSNDIEKYNQWQMTLRWAEHNSLEYLLPILKDEEKYIA